MRNSWLTACIIGTRWLWRWNHSCRKWETFSDATRLRGLPTYRVKGSLCTGRSRTPLDLPEQTAFHPVSRRPAQTSGVRKRLPFSHNQWSDYTVIGPPSFGTATEFPPSSGKSPELNVRPILSGSRPKTAPENVLSLSYTFSSHKRVVFSNAAQTSSRCATLSR